MKIIPAIDLMDGKVVRLYKGDPKQKTIYSENPVEVAKQWESAGADILHLVDLDATLGRGSNLDIIKKILEGVEDGSWAYFVHSYRVKPESNDVITAESDYGIKVPAVVEQDNFYGTQFHPEKSSTVGKIMLENFLKECKK